MRLWERSEGGDVEKKIVRNPKQPKRTNESSFYLGISIVEKKD
jgi:hypothetical protein